LLDGLVIQTTDSYKYPLKPIYVKTETMLDVERQVMYYPDCEIHSIVQYFDPRKDKNHERPLRTRIHKIMTQLENFMFSQLTLEEITQKEIVFLHNMCEMNPVQIYFDLVVGWYHTEGWRKLFQPFGEVNFADDLIFIRHKVKLAKYHIRGVDFKFYRMNTDENMTHRLKYPFGWMGLTKCEIPTPILLIENDKDAALLLQTLAELQKIRKTIVGEAWTQIQFEVGAKTYARSDSLYAWSGNDQNLQGTLKIDQTELTKRERMSIQDYFGLVSSFGNADEED
jgi:hypothetical protein